jgi:hypothetical protein
MFGVILVDSYFGLKILLESGESVGWYKCCEVLTKGLLNNRLGPFLRLLRS